MPILNTIGLYIEINHATPVATHWTQMRYISFNWFSHRYNIFFKYSLRRMKWLMKKIKIINGPACASIATC